EREYMAVVWGAFDQPKGSIDAPVGRSATHRTRMAVVKPAFGRHAVTHYLVEQDFGGLVSLMRLQLETGRTHQIRVHMAHAGHPLLGDLVYGAGFVTRRTKLTTAAATALDELGRQALHAVTLGFEHPVTGKKLHFESEPAADLARLIDTLRRS
ncbi:MAG: RluA family pseudouridine synthase, partial [Hyphomicrobiaceae bacterium]